MRVGKRLNTAEKVENVIDWLTEPRQNDYTYWGGVALHDLLEIYKAAKISRMDGGLGLDRAIAAFESSADRGLDNEHR